MYAPHGRDIACYVSSSHVRTDIWPGMQNCDLLMGRGRRMCGVCKLVRLNQGPRVHRSAAVSGGEDLRHVQRPVSFFKKSQNMMWLQLSI